MNKQIMIKHYEATPKETLIDILLASREEVEKLQNRNKECKREIERLNNTINNAIEFINGGNGWKKYKYTHQEQKLLEILGSDK